MRTSDTGEGGGGAARPNELSGGRYQIIDFIGKGGMGAVYRARDRDLGRTVAVKCVLDAASDAAQKRAAREARSLATLSHPNVMQIFDVVTEGDSVWIVGEWIDGVALDRLPMPLGAAATAGIMAQALEALAMIHANGIVHRDVKPSNLMLTRDGRVKLIDFGVAFHPGASSGETIAGSLRYTDPRILAGSPPDSSSDLYAACLVLLELLTGEAVWPALAPLPLYRLVTSTLEARVRELGDGQHPVLAVLAVRLAAQVMMPKESARSEVSATAAACAETLREMHASLGLGSVESDLRACSVSGVFDDARCADALTRQILEVQRRDDVRPRERAGWDSYALARGMALGAAPNVRSSRVVNIGALLGLIIACVAVAWGTRAPVNPGRFSMPEVSPSTPAASSVLDKAISAASQPESAPTTPNFAESQPERTQPSPLVTTPQQERSRPTPVVDASLQESAYPTPRIPNAVMVSPSAPPVASRSARSLPPKVVSLQIRADAWADVFLDGRSVGRIPRAGGFAVAPGKHRLRLTSPFVETYERTIEVPAQATFVVTASLAKRRHPVTFVLPRPAILTIAGKTHPNAARVTVDLPYGDHMVQIARPGEDPSTKRVAIGPGSAMQEVALP